MITKTAIGQRVRTLRERRGITQARLGRDLGYTSHVPIVNIESGKTDVSLVELQKIANVLRFPLQDLIPGLPTKRPSNALLVALRASSALTSKDRDEIIRYYQLKRKQRQEARQSMLGGLRLETREGARALARYHHRELGIASPPADLDHAMFCWNIEYDERDLGERISGVLFRDAHLRLICVNSADTRLRRRMTTAHELGHFHLDTAEFDITYPDQHSSDEELAFQYANELLMPSEWLKANKERWQRDPIGVSRDCQVSPIACEVWARALGLPLPQELEFRNKHEEILNKWRTRRVSAKPRETNR